MAGNSTILNFKHFVKILILGYVLGFVLGKNPNFSNLCDGLLPALENKTTNEIVAKNLNALHQA